jgi:hypothetical protein
VGVAVFIALTLILGLENCSMRWMVPFSTVASTWAVFRCKGLTERCVMWCFDAGAGSRITFGWVDLSAR